MLQRSSQKNDQKVGETANSTVVDHKIDESKLPASTVAQPVTVIVPKQMSVVQKLNAMNLDGNSIYDEWEAKSPPPKSADVDNKMSPKAHDAKSAVEKKPASASQAGMFSPAKISAPKPTKPLGSVLEKLNAMSL